MHSSTVGPDINPPQDLEIIDAKYGSNTQGAYIAAVHTAPHLDGLVVALGAYDSDAYFARGHDGLRNSYVGINPPAFYNTDPVRQRIREERFSKFNSLMVEKGITPGVKELLSVAILHEMGHGDEWIKTLAKNTGDPIDAMLLANRVRRSQLATLPMKDGIAVEIRRYEANENGVRDAYYASGKTDADFEMAWKGAVRAYAELPVERVADQFALGVMATAHA